GGVARDGAHVAHARAGGARLHLRAIRGPRVQPHRGPRAGRAEPAHPGAGAAVGAAHAASGVGSRRRGGGGVPRDRVGAEPAVLRAGPARPRVHLGLQLRKRFTHWSHLWLGLADGIATPAGYLAVTGRWSEPWWLLPVGALAVTFWVGGFDVFYALQDEAFDRSERLESLVVRLGSARAILAAKVLHGVALVALVLFGMGAGLGVAYYVGVAVGAALIGWEHRVVTPGDVSRV